MTNINEVKKIVMMNLKLATIKEDLKPKGNQEWLNYGKDNLYPQSVAKYFDSSPTNQSIVKYKSDLTSGEGFITSDEKLETFISENKLNKTLNRLAVDFILYGGFAVQVISNLAGGIANIEYINFASIRVGLPNEKKEVTNYYISTDWTQYKKSDYKPFTINAYNPKTLKKDKVQIYYYVQHYPNLYYYTQPDYSSALNYVELEAKLQKFHLRAVENNFTPPIQITFPTVPSPEERQMIKQDLEESFSGEDNALKPIVSFVEGVENKILIEPIQVTSNVDVYNSLNDLCITKITVAHRLTSPELIGISSGGASLGGDANKIVVAYEYFYNNIIRNKQIQIVDVFKDILKDEYNTKDLTISNTKPLTYVPESILTANFTENEIREIYGYQPKEITTNII